MANSSEIAKTAIYVVLGAAIIWAISKVWNTVTGWGGAIAEGAEWIAEGTSDYIDYNVKLIKDNVKVLEEGADNLYDYEKKLILDNIDNAGKGLDVIKKNSKAAYDYITSFW